MSHQEVLMAARSALRYVEQFARNQGKIMTSTMQAEIWPLMVYFFLIIAAMAGVMGLSYLSGERHARRRPDEQYESGIVAAGPARLRLSVGFYLVAMFFVIFDVEALFLYAWAIALREAGWAGYIEVLVFIGILLAALAYIWRLGALDWARRPVAPGIAGHDEPAGGFRQEALSDFPPARQ
jgi:NADH-quinone oxidoreductase subunit A